MFERRAIERTRRGDYRVRLSGQERSLVRTYVAELGARLGGDAPGDDPALRRLFPPAYDRDAVAEEEYRRLVREELASGRREALRVVEETIARDRLSLEEAEAWLGALNDVRLVLGTILDVSEETYEQDVDAADPGGRELAVFAYLTWLEQQLVEALASAFE